jgi:hypothetical protein
MWSILENRMPTRTEENNRRKKYARVKPITLKLLKQVFSLYLPQMFWSFSKDSLLGTLYLALRFIHSYTYFFQNQIPTIFKKRQKLGTRY